MAPSKNPLITSRLSSIFSNPESKEDLSQVCSTISSSIERGDIKLCEVVEELGEFLTSPDTSVRENGVRSLSTIIQSLSPDFLNDQELQLMTSFYCDRLKDHHTIIPSVLPGIVAMVGMKNLPKDAPGKLLHTLAQHVRCQSELQENRRNIYLIFQRLLEDRIEDLKALGPDFVYTVISSMDGESDPRNLLLLFQFLPKFMREFPLGHLTEEMFEVIACYFPIDFSSGKEGKGISRQDLAGGLEKCLSTLPGFSEFCLPLLLEKLNSSLKVAKLDALSLLSASAGTFGTAGLKEYLDEIWTIIRREVLPGNDQDVRAMALKAITDVSKVVAEDTEICEKFVGAIITATKSSFCDIQLSLFWPAERVLEAVARGDKVTCAQVLKAVLPLSLGQYSTKTIATDKISLLETISSFISISRDHGFKISDIPELTWTDIPNLYLNELDGAENVLKAKAFVGLSIQVSSLSETHRKNMYEKLCSEIDGGLEELKPACNLTLLTFAKAHSNEVKELLQTRLTIGENVPRDILQNRLQALSSIAKIPDLAPKILPSVLQVAVSEASASSAALSCLQALLLDDSSDFNIHSYLEGDCGAIGELVESVNSKNFQRMQLVSNICCAIVRKLSIDAQKIVIDRHFDSLRSRVTDNIILLEGILTPLAPEIVKTIPINVLEELFEISLKGPEEETRSSACRLAAILVNKIEDLALGRYLNIFRETLTQIFESENGFEEKKAAAVLHTWLTKSLVVKGSRESQNFLDNQLNILKNEVIGEFMGEQFKILIDRNERTLTEENRCNVKIFYKQRVFQTVIQQNGLFENGNRQSYLIALSHLVEEIPVELLPLHLSKIVPLLVESLSMESSQLVLSTLNTLHHLLETKDAIFVEQIQSFIPRCLRLSGHPAMQVRIAALNCLHSYSNYPTPIIKMYKDDVVDKLAETVDDKKRLVRRVAVRTRTKWYLVGAPGGPD